MLILKCQQRYRLYQIKDVTNSRGIRPSKPTKKIPNASPSHIVSIHWRTASYIKVIDKHELTKLAANKSTQ
jgi:hypothetical protein